jgi:4-aminobutyrate aminotransferase-like enzyme
LIDGDVTPDLITFAKGVNSGYVLGPQLNQLAERHPSVGDVRGIGVFWALELVRDRHTREPLVPFNASGVDAMPMIEFGAACKATWFVAIHSFQSNSPGST